MNEKSSVSSYTDIISNGRVSVSVGDLAEAGLGKVEAAVGKNGRPFHWLQLTNPVGGLPDRLILTQQIGALLEFHGLREGDPSVWLCVGHRGAFPEWLPIGKSVAKTS